MNWGYKIALIYGIFVLMIISFLVIASNQTNEMVEDHYYEKEIKYQDVIQASQNLTDKKEKLSIEIINSAVHISIPENQIPSISDLKIDFIRLSDKSLDVSLFYRNIDTNEIIIPGNKFQAGLYQLRIEWFANRIPYNYQNSFNYPKIGI